MLKKETQVIKFEQNLCKASVDDNKILFVRVTDQVKNKKAMFEVPLTHIAYVIKGGGDGRVYKSGTYPVFDDKTEVKNWKIGSSVDIIYMPKDPNVPIKWGTKEKIKYRDEASNKVISVAAHGVFDVVIVNPEQFFRKVVGVKKEFSLDEFQERFSANVLSEFTDNFLKVVDELKLTYDKFDANKKKIQENTGKLLSKIFENSWGIGLSNFVIEYLGISDEDSNAVEEAAAEVKKNEKVKEYLAELERLDDKQWEREKYLRQLELADKNAYYEVLKIIGHPKDNKTGSFCSNCGAEISGNDKFCAKCGKKVGKDTNLCPKCGKLNDKDAVFCSSCGTKLK